MMADSGKGDGATERQGMEGSDVSRRHFVKTCGTVATLVAVSAGGLAPPAVALAQAPRLKLVDKAGRPFKAGELAVDANYVFLYPYVSTPCLLLRLSAPTPRNVQRTDAKSAPYTWPGGVGRDGAVVAYSAICAHQLSYDSRQTSFLTYHTARGALSGHDHAITCCAHGSTYDPAAGAKVTGGPAQFPLAAVQFSYDAASDELTAVGMVGTALFDEFFKAYRADLNAEFGRGAYRALVADRTTVLPMREFSKDVIAC